MCKTPAGDAPTDLLVAGGLKHARPERQDGGHVRKRMSLEGGAKKCSNAPFYRCFLEASLMFSESNKKYPALGVLVLFLFIIFQDIEETP